MGLQHKSVAPLIGFSLAALVTACAQTPENVLAFSVSDEAYQQMDCTRLSAEANRLNAALDAEYEHQRDARSDDAAGVFFLGLPVASMSGRNRTEEIARLKGELNAIESVAEAQSCNSVITSIKSARATRDEK